MSTRHLDELFDPRSVAVIGASQRPHSVGATVLTNLCAGGFAGPIWPVNPKYRTLAGLPVFADVGALPAAPELAVLCTPPDSIPGLVGELGELGTRAALVLSAGLRCPGRHGTTLEAEMLAAARPYRLRIVGPNCVGVLVPGAGLNASFAPRAALPGGLAFVSQSGALTTAVLDWAASQRIGFSHFVSLGDSADVDFGDVIDYLAVDPATHAILLYIESISAARKFLTAARAAARNKPVLAVKAGRVAEGARAAASHTGALAGSDAVYDAALRRAGLLRVNSLDELFNAVETLACVRGEVGEALAIMTNGGGAGVMATDALVLGGGQLARLGGDSRQRLRGLLPDTASLDNPVDIVGDAQVVRYGATLQVLLDDPGVDAVLLIHAPTAIVPSDEIAGALLPLLQAAAKPVFTAWLGGEAVATARRRFDEAGLPCYATPEQAVRAFLQVRDYRRNQELLMRTPPSLSPHVMPDRAAARVLIEAALACGQGWLDEVAAKALLAAYGIPVVSTRLARSADEAVAHADALGYPVALKVVAPGVLHKSELGGVWLGLDGAAAVRAAAATLQRRLAARRPEATLTGFAVQAMADTQAGIELIVGASSDAVFGPVILFGHGGTAVEAIDDHALALPPLDPVLADELVSRTRVARLLAGYRDRPPADRTAIALTLVRLSQLLCDLPEVRELDINPLLAGPGGVLALDARVGIAPAAGPAAARLAIRPYPSELETRADWRGEPLLLRPIRPEDEPLLQALLAGMNSEDLHFRFFGMVRRLAHVQLARLTQIDYDRDMVLVAESQVDGHPCLLGMAQAMSDPDNDCAEFAVLVHSPRQGGGLGRLLMERIIAYARQRGTRQLVGEVLADNARMLALAQALGFRRGLRLGEAGVVRVSLPLQDASPEAAAGQCPPRG